MDESARRALDVLGMVVLENEHRWGECATAEQRADAEAILDLSAPQRMHWLSRARGYSKSSDVGFLSLAVMVTQLVPGAACYAAAADRDQAALMVSAMRGAVQRTPELAGAFDVQQMRVAALRSGVTLEVMAADAASAWGLRPAWLIADELCQWADVPNSREFWLALSSALPKMPDSRLICITTAGDPAHFSRRIYETALSEPELWRVSDLAGPPPWTDPRRVAAERRRLLPSQFARLWMNEWTAGEDRLVSPEDLEAAVTLDGPQPYREGVQYVVTLDVGVMNDRTALVVAHADGGQDAETVRVTLDRLLVWAGSRADPVDLESVAEAAYGLCAEFRAPLVYDPSQAILLAQRLRDRGVAAEQFTFSASSVGLIASALYSVLHSRRLALPDDADLIDELAHIRLRTNSAGTVRVDHDSSRHDDRGVALGMAAWWLLSRLGAGPQFVVLPDDGLGAGQVNQFGHEVMAQVQNFARRASWGPSDDSDRPEEAGATQIAPWART